MTAGPERSAVAVGAVAGLAGVALSAAAAHLSGPGSLDVSARFLLVHAPAFIALAAALRTGIVHRRTGVAAVVALAVGLALFSGDLAFRVLVGSPLLPMAAPTGGVLLMGGWALVAVAALLGER